ncbi:uncharacterized protein PHALS_13765 [Plasmopara halstedii]|uniref:Uncharacterized protein n=1 Tax=Plasmopara halstedii TaxID=4781 RepID=A0A0P1AR58_PLAHL|nr:uncharacterized protein PHALS_13765 [Plasmopara halstedii]CEG43573.1 hypothetical protein PHALS_13765 [Plasmopara halstedii]|eukprot:XP_024579942.1 hypothetical protein PHALS_13765 [Plasmopara halstedii]
MTIRCTFVCADLQILSFPRNTVINEPDLTQGAQLVQLHAQNTPIAAKLKDHLDLKALVCA